MAHHAAAAGDVALFERLSRDQPGEGKRGKRFSIMWLLGGKSTTRAAPDADQRSLATSFNAYGFAPIHAAAFHGHADVIDMLVCKFGVDANQPSQSSTWTLPLHLSILCNHVGCVKTLLGHHANPWLRDGEGWDAWDVAHSSGHRRCTALLNSHLRKQREQCLGIVEAGSCTLRPVVQFASQPALLVDCFDCSNVSMRPLKSGMLSDSDLNLQKMTIHHGKGAIPYGPWDVESGIATHDAPTYSSLDLPSSNRVDTSDSLI